MDFHLLRKTKMNTELINFDERELNDPEKALEFIREVEQANNIQIMQLEKLNGLELSVFAIGILDCMKAYELRINNMLN